MLMTQQKILFCDKKVQTGFRIPKVDTTSRSVGASSNVSVPGMPKA